LEVGRQSFKTWRWAALLGDAGKMLWHSLDVAALLGGRASWEKVVEVRRGEERVLGLGFPLL